MPILLDPATSPDDGLTTLARVKEYAGITGTASDAKLTNLLSAASSVIERYCDRRFALADHIEYLDGRSSFGNSFLKLSHGPVASIQRIATRPVRALNISNISDSNQLAGVELRNGTLTLKRTASGVAAANNLTIGDYATISQLADAVASLSNGWATVTDHAYANYPAAYLKAMQGTVSAKQSGTWVQLFADDLNFLQLDSERGTLYGAFPAGSRNIEVRYSAGMSEIPDDVQQACVMLVKAMDDDSGNDANLKSEKIGDYFYDRGASTNGNDLFAIMPAAVKSLLAFYRNDPIL